MLENFLKFVGCYALICYLYDNLRTPCWIILRRIRQIFGNEKVKESLMERFGLWAVITGSTDGIGKEYAKELANRGFNVVLIARNETKLQTVAKEIENDYHVETKIIIADFTKGPEVYEHIKNELSNTPIGMLINNVGTARRPGRLFNYSREELQNIIDTNIVAATQLSRYFLNRMQYQRTKGAIVNVSSGTELFPVPNAAVYAASKAYIRSLTFALAEEARPFGVTVQLLSPDFVVTKINSYSPIIMRGGLFIPDAKTYAQSAVSLLAHDVDVSTGYFWHAVQTAFVKLLPMRAQLYIFQKIFNFIVDKNEKKL